MRANHILASAVISILLPLSSCSGNQEKTEQVKHVQLYTGKGTGGAAEQQFPGRVVAAQEVNMAFKVSGTLMNVRVDEGSKVRKGQLIAEIDPRDYQLQLEATAAEYHKIKSEADRVIALYKDSVATADTYDKARYGLQQITAKYQNAKNQLADTKIYAPFSGTVQQRFFDPPTVIGAGMPVVSIISDGRQEVEINIPASTYARRTAMQSFTTSFDFLPDQKIDLQLISIAPKANANQLYTVRLSIPANLPSQPAPGMNAMVDVTFNDCGTSSTTIPATAVFKDGKKSCVWIYDKSKGTVNRREVQIERLRTDGNAVISSGINAGETIVTAGVHKLTEGEKVVPAEKKSETNVGDLL